MLGSNSRESEFDYQRKAGGERRSPKGDECLCNSSGAQSNLTAPANKEGRLIKGSLTIANVIAGCFEEVFFVCYLKYIY